MSDSTLVACEIARLVMGRLPPDKRTTAMTEWAADEDPLAWWCLVELLLAFKRGEIKSQKRPGLNRA